MSANLLNHPIISERYFFPRKENFESPFWVKVEGANLGCHWQRSEANKQTVVHFHGNGEVVADYSLGFSQRLLAGGCNAFFAEFRGYGMSDGQPELGKMLDDVKFVIEAVPAELEDIVVFGRSVGSLFAMEAVSLFPQIGGLIIESGISDPLERLRLRMTAAELGVSDETLLAAVTQRLNQQQKMQDYENPVLIMHTKNDGIVDLRHGQELHQWAKGRSELVVFEEGNHNTISWVNEEAYFAQVFRFFSTLK